MTTIDPPVRSARPGFLDRLVGRFKVPAAPQLVPDPHPQLRGSPWQDVETTSARTVDGFVSAAFDVPGVRRITARTSGPTVSFRVAASVPRHEVIDALEPRLRALTLSGSPFDYSVIELQWGEPDPVGYLELWAAPANRGEPVGLR